MKYILPILALMLSANTVFAQINWMSFEEAWEANKKEPKKMLVDVYTDWCGPCKMMDQKTFKQPDIVKYINKNFYAVKLNAERKDSVTIDGRTYFFVKAGRRGIHTLAKAVMKDSPGYPTVTFFNEKGELIKAIPGYKSALEMDKLLHFYNENHYERTPYNLFEKTFRSRLEP